MSNLRVNTVSPRTTPNVDIQGVSVPTYLGSPLAIESSVQTRFNNLNGNTLLANQPVPGRFISTSVSGQIYEVLFALETALGVGGTNQSIEALATLLVSMTDEPIGVIKYYYGYGAPTGYIRLDGSLLSRTTYSQLYNFVLSSQGALVSETDYFSNQKFGNFAAGDGSTTFRAPDLRGLFLRNLDIGRGINTDGGALGQYQNDDIKSHVHPLSSNVLTEGVPGDGPGGTTGGSSGPPVQTEAFGGTETKPKNVSLGLIMKATQLGTNSYHGL